MSQIDLRSSASVEVPEPTAEEIKAFRQRRISVAFSSQYVDTFAVANAPKGVHVEWHRDDPHTVARLEKLGFQRNPDLGRTNPHINSDTSAGPRINDVVCWTIPEWQKKILDEVSEMRKQAADDPRRAAKFMEGQITEDEKMTNLPAKDKINTAKTITGASAQALIQETAVDEALRVANSKINS